MKFFKFLILTLTLVSTATLSLDAAKRDRDNQEKINNNGGIQEPHKKKTKSSSSALVPATPAQEQKEAFPDAKNQSELKMLPNELLAHLSSFLNAQEVLVTLSCVDHHFNEVIKNPLIIATLDLSRYCITEKEEVKSSARSRTVPVQKIIKILTTYSQLQKLIFCGSSITDGIFKALVPYLKSVKLLTLDCTNVFGAGLAALAQLTQLESLDLINNFSNDDELAVLGQLIHLKHLNLRDCRNATGAKLLTILAPLREKLHYLNIRNIRMAGTELKELAHFINLKGLDLTYIYMNNPELKALAPLTKLQSFSLPYHTTNDELKALVTQFPNLHTLILKECPKITDTGLLTLAQLTELKRLSLATCTKITDDGLTALAQLTSLQELNLASIKVTETGLRALASLPHFKHLNLKWTAVSDNELNIVALFKELQHLDLCWCQNITDNGIKVLVISLTNLQSLNLSCCKKLSNKYRKQFNRQEIIALREELLKEQAYSQASSRKSLMEGGR